MNEVNLHKEEPTTADDDIIPRGLMLLSNPGRNETRENLYIALRKEEGRLYSSAEVQKLPDLPLPHKHAAEWEIRKRSYIHLKRYLDGKQAKLNIFDLGCGNGWMTNALSLETEHSVVGMDLNIVELEQAITVFGHNPNLRFLYGDIFDLKLRASNFDVAVLASAIQYFPNPASLICRLFDLLSPKGEIHIIDTPFYEPTNIEAARERSHKYYSSIGFPEMAQYYFHHLSESIAIFKPHRMDRTITSGFSRLLGKGRNSFPWYMIQKP